MSPQYLAKVNWLTDPPEVGTELKVNQQYLDSALDELTVVGASLSHLLMRKLCPKSVRDSVDEDALMLTFQLLNKSQWKIVDKVAGTALPEITREYSRTSVKVNRWIALKRLGGTKAIADEVTAWDISALQQIFELARLILLEDPSAIDLARTMMQSGNLDWEQVENWPLFEDIRSSFQTDHIDGLNNGSQASSGEAETVESTPEDPTLT